MTLRASSARRTWDSREQSKEIDFYYGSGDDRPISIYIASVYGGHDGDLDFDETGDATIFSGPSSAAVFLPGTYTFPMGYETLGEVSNEGDTYGDTLTISLLGSGTAATPEPGMLTLVGSGALAGAASVRRRLRAG